MRDVSREPAGLSVRLYDGLEVRMHLAESDAWGSALVWHTGSEAHLTRLQGLADRRGLHLAADGVRRLDGRRVAGRSEEDVYRALDLPWIAPELREDSGEIEAGLEGGLPNLISIEDLQ